MLRHHKNILSSKIIAVICLIFSFSSCETFELEILDDPNALTNDQADADLFLNAIEISLAGFFDGNQLDDNLAVSEMGMEVTRILHMFGPLYDNAYQPGDYDICYEDAYAGLLADVQALEPIAEEAGLFTHIGISKIIEAYVMMTLVDYFGDLPYSEAFQGLDNTNPVADDDANIYNDVEDLLNEGLRQLDRNERFKANTDLFYGGNEASWAKLANTLKLKLYLQTRLVDANAGAKINNLLANEDLILDLEDDFQFQYSNVDANPDSRHPYFGRNFDVAADVNDYMSNYYMTLIKDDFATGDPRRRYYFYRQSLDFTEDPNENECILVARPTHYSSNDVFCNPGDGYWGRDHGDDDGIPPDGGLRTTFGVYPIGGPFDASVGDAISGRRVGLQGAGISPIMLSSYTNFMLAEAALTAGVTGDPRFYLEQGVRQSIQKVLAFGERLPLDEPVKDDDPDTPEDETVIPRPFVPSNSDIELYVNNVLDRYDAASGEDRVEIVVIEYFKALFGNGVEAYNTYRRTGFPSDLQPTLTLNSGEFINSFPYPSELFQQNSNVSQKPAPSQSLRVFWAEGGPVVD